MAGRMSRAAERRREPRVTRNGTPRWTRRKAPVESRGRGRDPRRAHRPGSRSRGRARTGRKPSERPRHAHSSPGFRVQRAQQGLTQRAVAVDRARHMPTGAETLPGLWVWDRPLGGGDWCLRLTTRVLFRGQEPPTTRRRAASGTVRAEAVLVGSGRERFRRVRVLPERAQPGGLTPPATPRPGPRARPAAPGRHEPAHRPRPA